MQDKLLHKLLSKAEHLPELATNLGVAYTGYKSCSHWSGALTALVAYKLAQSMNPAAGLAGVGVLAYLGLTAFSDGENIKPPTKVPYNPIRRGEVVHNVLISDCISRGGTVVFAYPMNSEYCTCEFPEISELPKAPPLEPPPPPQPTPIRPVKPGLE